MDNFTLLIVLFVYPVISAEGTGCPSSVEGYFGQDIVVECKFVSTLIGVYWFDERDDNAPLIRLENGIKGGVGYLRGEYDVTTNGSLVIRNAKWTNDMRFKVIIIDTAYSDDTFYTKVSVLEHCPMNQFSLAGEEATIVCHFKPGFVGVYWFEMEDDEEPLIRLEGTHRSGKGFPDKYDIHRNGSLIIRRVPNGYRNKFFVLLLSADFEQHTDHVNVQAVYPCGVLSNPKNGAVIQTATIALFICNEGYHLQGSNRSYCVFHEMAGTFPSDGDETLCIPDSLSRATTARISHPIEQRTTKQTPAYGTTEGHGVETRHTKAGVKSSTTEYGNNLPHNDKVNVGTPRNDIPVFGPITESETAYLKDRSHAGSVVRSSWTLVTLVVTLSFSSYVSGQG